VLINLTLIRLKQLSKVYSITYTSYNNYLLLKCTILDRKEAIYLVNTYNLLVLSIFKEYTKLESINTSI